MLVLVGVACGKDKAPASSDTVADADACDTAPQEQDSGLVITDTVCGDGDEVVKGDTIKVNYTGMLEDGTVFDSTNGTPVEFPFPIGAGQLIAGWEEGIPGMKEGGKRTLLVPPDLGYGASGFPPTIPPDATLTFEIELVEITTAPGAGSTP
jgi:FKBP-type peptidyl-prolyl cis-trans isomerase